MNNKPFKILCACLALSIALGWIYQQESRPHDLEVYFLDVGQGDSILIRTPDNQDILIDGGPGQTVLMRLAAVLPFWDRDIELMILTHPHDDHVAGLVPVLERYQVEQVWYTQAAYENPNYLEFQKIIQEKNIPHQKTFYGNKLEVGENLFLETLYPFSNMDLNEIENINNTSIINRLVYGETEFLFTGDAETEVEEILLHNQLDLHADLLKAGHHGSKTASSKEFLAAVQPKIVMIQCGLGNKFNHPHFKTLLALQEIGVEIFRNDLAGTIKCESNAIVINCKKML